MKTLNPSGFLIITTNVLVMSILILLFYKDVPATAEKVIYIVVGVIIAKWGTMIDYHFGSSSGSAAKQAMIEKIKTNGETKHE